MRLVQNNYCILQVDLHCPADHWVEDVIVGAEDQLSSLCETARGLSSTPGLSIAAQKRLTLYSPQVSSIKVLDCSQRVSKGP